MQGAGAQLPSWLASCGPALAERPRAVLLAVLLQRAPPVDLDYPAWFEAVAVGYVRECVLPLPTLEQPDAEHDLVQAVAHLGQQRLLCELGGTLAAQAAAGGAAALQREGSSGAGEGSAQLRAAALRYFASGATLAAAAAAQLLLQGLEVGAATLETVLSNPAAPSAAELEVVALGVLVPAWEAVLQRIQHGGGRAPGVHDALGANTSLAARQALVQCLCAQCEVAGERVLGLPPPLVAEVCRESFELTRACAVLLQRCQAGAPERAAEHTRQVLQYNDLVSRYISNKLQIG